MTHSINWIRDNFETFLKLTKARNFKDFELETLLKIDEERRNLILQTQELQNTRNNLAKQIGKSKGEPDKYNDLMKQSTNLKSTLSELEEKTKQKQADLDYLLDRIPNILQDSVPHGADENDNVEIKKWGNVPVFSHLVKDHAELGIAVQMMDFETAAQNSGSRFVYLYSKLAKLERALINFALAELETEGFTEVSPPLMVNSKAYYGTGQLPKFEGDFFKAEEDKFLISTAEISLANIFNNKIVAESELSTKYCAATPCFRSEAGSSGKDTKGMIRMHQFYKVEMVIASTPEKSDEEHLKMLAITEKLLQKLELPYRVINLCSGDIGFSANKTYDIECWMPAQNKYREVASISNTGDFQARRMMARFKRSDVSGKGKNEYIHLLNGTAIACGRILCCLLENNQQPNGSIKLPPALHKYLGFEGV